MSVRWQGVRGADPFSGDPGDVLPSLEHAEAAQTTTGGGDPRTADLPSPSVASVLFPTFPGLALRLLEAVVRGAHVRA